MAILGIILAFLIGVSAIVAVMLMLYSAWRYVPFVPTSRKDMRSMLDEAELADGQTVYDLGCGDGRFLIEAKKRKNITAVGIEAAYWVYSIARLRRLISGQDIDLRWENFFETDLSDADIIICYLFPKIMTQLKEKFERELKPGTKIISLSFPLHGWIPKKTLITRADKPKNFLIYVYEV